MICNNISKEPRLIDSKLVFVPTKHKVVGTGAIRCTQCNRVWCSSECAVSEDALDHEAFDLIYECQQPPSVFEVVCCRCSGRTPSWRDPAE